MISAPSLVLLKHCKNLFAWTVSRAGTCLLALGPIGHLYADDSVVVMQTHLHPPYQVMQESYLSGDVPNTLKCIFDRMGRDYVINLAPRKRSRQLIKDDRIDGFFLSTPDEELDETSIPTQPLALERWNYFYLKSGEGPARPENEVVGAVLGSNEALWLKQHGKRVIDTIPDLSSLVRVVQSNRIPYALADESAFKVAASKVGMPLYMVEARFVKYVPLMAYFSKTFVVRNPGFIENFNSSLNSCVTRLHEAKQSEEAHLLKLARRFLEKHKAVFIDHMKSQTKNIKSIFKRHDEDKDWKDAVHAGRQNELMQAIQSNGLSQLLSKLADDNGEITEIFLTDQTGFIIAMNQTTSDYWQGDEKAYEAIVDQGKGHHVSQIQFDHSTRKFQIQVTLPVMGDGKDERLGHLTIGYDADRAFQF